MSTTIFRTFLCTYDFVEDNDSVGYLEAGDESAATRAPRVSLLSLHRSHALVHVERVPSAACARHRGHPRISYRLQVRSRFFQWFEEACSRLLSPHSVCSALYAGLLWRARDSIQHRNGDGAEHLSFLFRNYSPKFFYFDVVDNCRRIALTGMLVSLSYPRVSG